MNPRKDLDFLISETSPNDPVAPHLILRRGIPFGPEVTTEEKLTKSTKHERGLYFVSYQSNLANGFSFLQKSRSRSILPRYTCVAFADGAYSLGQQP
jgi:deferrochelatase/peroxidase EfeB